MSRHLSAPAVWALCPCGPQHGRPRSTPAPGSLLAASPCASEVCNLRSLKIFFSLAKPQYLRQAGWDRGDPALPLHIKQKLYIIMIIICDCKSF